MESPGWEKTSGVRLYIPVTDAASARIPKALRDRLLGCKTTPAATAAEIEVKLSDAHLRRQKFYEEISNKARRFLKTPSKDSSREEELGHRLESKLQAAEQKRQSILSEAKTRLGRRDEARQSVRTRLEVRFEEECAKRGSEFKSRCLRAEANRERILSSRAGQLERRSQRLLRRAMGEAKRREGARAAMHQKLAQAERKRAGLLQAQRDRAGARIVQVRGAAQRALTQHEAARRRIGTHLEDRLQRARRHRAEALRQRGRLLNAGVRVGWVRMQKKLPEAFPGDTACGGLV